jgi:hypothetical protein
VNNKNRGDANAEKMMPANKLVENFTVAYARPAKKQWRNISLEIPFNSSWYYFLLFPLKNHNEIRSLPFIIWQIDLLH